MSNIKIKEMPVLTPSQVKEFVKAVIKGGENTWIWGPPGIGKSDCVKQLSVEMGMDMIDVRTSLFDRVDLSGVPTVQDGFTKWCQPIFLPRTEKPTILFLDELSQAQKDVQGALLQLTLDRRINEYVLPKNTHVVAAGNRLTDRAGGSRIITPLLTRFIHCEATTSLDEFLSFSMTQGLPYQIMAYIRSKPDDLMVPDDKLSGSDSAYPCPRSWFKLGNVMKPLLSKEGDLLPKNHQILSHLALGTVGYAAHTFLAYLKYFNNLPDIELPFKEGEKAPYPKENHIMYAYSTAVASRGVYAAAESKNPKQMVENFCKWLEGFEKDEMALYTFKLFKDGIYSRDSKTFSKIAMYQQFQEMTHKLTTTFQIIG